MNAHIAVVKLPPHADAETVEQRAKAETLDELEFTVLSTGYDGCVQVATKYAGQTLHEDGFLTDAERKRYAEAAASLLPGIDASDIDQRLESLVSNQEGGNRPEPYFKPITAAELDAGDYELNYLIPSIIAERQPLIVAGQSKSMKTTLMLDASISLASGSRFLNHFHAASRNTLVLTAESGLATVQETCRRICKSRGLSLGQVPGLMFCDRVPQLTNASHMAELARILKGEGIEVLICDPAYMCLDGADAGNMFAMGAQLKLFAELANEAQATPILLHHAKKNTMNAADYQPLELGDIAWAGFGEFARQWLLLSRRERYTEGSGEHRLWVTAGGSAGHSGCWGVDIAEGHPDDPDGRRWDVSVSTAGEARETAQQRKEREKADQQDRQKQAKLAVARERVKDAYRGQDALTKSDIKDRAGISGTIANEIIGQMVREGELTAAKVTKSNNQEYPGYRLEWDKLSHPDHPDSTRTTPGQSG